MKLPTNFKALTLITAMAFAGFSCSDSTGGTDDSNQAQVSGKVESTNAKVSTSSATVVTAAEVTANGSFRTIEGTETNVDASGNFTMFVDADAYQNFVIQAQSSSTTTMGYVSGEVENGASYTLKPINSESSAETSVYARLVASGKNEMVTKGEIEAVVTSENSAEINSNSSYAAEIATSLSNAAQVRAEYYESEFSSNANAQLEAVFTAMVEAQADLEAKLYSSTSVEAGQAAYTEFNSAMVEAYAQSSVELSVAAKAVEMWSRAFMNSSASLTTEVKSEANKQVSLFTATMIDLAVQAETEASGASESTTDATIEAGTNLRANISASSGTEADIRAAFETYHDEVRAALESDTNFNASVIVSIDSDINVQSGPKFVFESAISSTLSANLMLDIYNEFHSQIEASVEEMASGSSQKIEALVELMILINTAS
jgi:hypothetical protein